MDRDDPEAMDFEEAAQITISSKEFKKIISRLGSWGEGKGSQVTFSIKKNEKTLHLSSTGDGGTGSVELVEYDSEKEV